MKTLADMKQEVAMPVIIADHQGFVTYINGQFEKIFGWTRNEVIGQPLTIIIPINLRDSHHMGFSRFLSTGAPTLLNRALTLKAVTKAGREMDCEHFIVAEQEQNQWVFGATLRPL